MLQNSQNLNCAIYMNNKITKLNYVIYMCSSACANLGYTQPWLYISVCAQSLLRTVMFAHNLGCAQPRLCTVLFAHNIGCARSQLHTISVLFIEIIFI